MKTEERELIQSLLAPLTGLPAILSDDRQQLASLLAPLAALPDAVRALARAQSVDDAKGEDADRVARKISRQYVAAEIAQLGGVALLANDTVESVMQRAMAEAWARGRDDAAPAVARIAAIEVVPGETLVSLVERVRTQGLKAADAELSEMYASGAREALAHATEQLAKHTGVELQDGDTLTDVIWRAGLATADARLAGAELVRLQIWRAAGLSGDPPGRSEDIVAAIQNAGSARDGREQVWRAAGLDGDPPNDAPAIVAAIQEQASARLARMLAEKERAEQRALALENTLGIRFAEGREQGRSESAVELERLQDFQLQLHEEARNQTVHELVARSGHPAVNAGEALDILASAIRDGIDASASLRDVRERAAQGALLAVLDERCPGARHERVGLSKVEDLPAVELRAEIARRWCEMVESGRIAEVVIRPGENYAVEGHAPGCTCKRCMPEKYAVEERAPDIVEVTILRNAAAMLRTVDGKLRQVLFDRNIDHEGADPDILVDRLVAARDAQAKTLDEAEQAYDAVERALRTALHNAGVVHQESDALQCVELLTLVASRNHNARERLDDALECINLVDAELRRFLTACGEQLTGQERVLDLARRLTEPTQRTVVEVPRSARDGARRELREIVSALGLRVEIDHLALPEARAAVIGAVQEQTTDRDATAEFERSAWQTLGLLCGKLGVWFDFASLVPPLDQGVTTIARAIREHYVNARHEDLARGQQLVVDAVCTALDVYIPNDSSVAHWAGRLKEHVTAGRPTAQVREASIAGQRSAGEPLSEVGADTTSEQRASVLAAVQALSGELPPEPTLGEACRELDERIYALTYWAKDNLPLLALWDAQLVENCPLAFEHLKRDEGSLVNVYRYSGEWNELARDLRAVAEGDDARELAEWLATGLDFRALLEVMLDRVGHLEEECAERDDKAESAKSEIDGRVEDLARALYERLPLGVAPQLVARCAQDLDRVDDPLVNGVRSLLAGAAGRAHDPRTLEDWCALAPAERNRLIDRTRDALAAVAA